MKMNKITLRAAVLAAVFSGVAATASVVAQQQSTPVPWSRCCGFSAWPAMGPGMMGRGMMGGGMMRGGMVGGGSGSMPRMHFAMMSGVPAPYNSMSNPLPRTRETVERGAAVYEQNCASCHGATGLGDGPVGRTLSPPPANLVFLAQMPMVQWDPFMYWTVAEGGAQFGSAMPAFKDALSKNDIWAVTAYVQARLPQTTAKQEQK
jgi:mono/diheme cytochrome c family protein